MSSEELERTLLRIEEQLRALAREAKKETVPLVALTVSSAAKALSRSRSIIWEMIRDGELRTVTIRKTRMVPMSEVLRVGSLPHAPRASAPVVRSTVASEMAKVDEMLRHKRAARKPH